MTPYTGLNPFFSFFSFGGGRFYCRSFIGSWGFFRSTSLVAPNRELSVDNTARGVSLNCCSELV